MKHETFTTHQIAGCNVCGIEWQDHTDHNARKKAYYHAKKTGHRCWVETGLVTKYN